MSTQPQAPSHIPLKSQVTVTSKLLVVEVPNFDGMILVLKCTNGISFTGIASWEVRQLRVRGIHLWQPYCVLKLISLTPDLGRLTTAPRGAIPRGESLLSAEEVLVLSP